MSSMEIRIVSSARQTGPTACALSSVTYVTFGTSRKGTLFLTGTPRTSWLSIVSGERILMPSGQGNRPQSQAIWGKPGA